MVLTSKNISNIGLTSRDGDPRQHKDWFLNHLDEIQASIDSKGMSPIEEMIKLNEELNIDVDFKSILQKNILD